MNPLAVEALKSIIKAGLQILAGYLVTKGIWTGDRADIYVEAAAVGLITLGWQIYDANKSRLKFLTALVSPQHATETQVNAQVANIPMFSTPAITSSRIETTAQSITVQQQIQEHQ